MSVEAPPCLQSLPQKPSSSGTLLRSAAFPTPRLPRHPRYGSGTAARKSNFVSKTSSQKPHASMPFTPSGRRAKSRRRSACRSKVLATPRAAPCTTTANTRTGSAATRATAVQRHYSHFHRRSPHYHCYCWIGLSWIGLDLAGLPNWLGWAGLDWTNWTGLGQFWYGPGTVPL